MSILSNQSISRKESISVEFFYKIVQKSFNIKLLSNKVGMDRKITDQNLHRPGLALAGFVDLFSCSRIQVFGNTEKKYLEQLSKEDRIKSVKKIMEFPIPGIIYSNGNEPEDEIKEMADNCEIPLFGSDFPTTKLTYLISDFLDDQFAPQCSMHGSFMDVYGVGMLFIGKSGIGKSEVALDLVERGHRLVADDVVILTKKGEGILMGSGSDTIKHFMEVRGIGIIDVRSMFGIRSIRFQKRLEIVVELEIWDNSFEYTRTGLDESTVNINGVDIPYIKLPILPGKNITVISETVALHYMLKHYGYNAAEKLQEQIVSKIKSKSSKIDRVIDYFEHDFE